MCGTENPSLNPNSLSKSSNGNVISKEHVLLNLDYGCPTVYEGYWSSEKMEDKCTVVIKGNELMGYVSDLGKACWFMEAGLEDAIRKLHRVTGNATVDGRHVVVGTGSTQLYHAVLYALTTTTQLPRDRPVSVVSAAPYYSQYPDETDFLRSGLFKWAGDAHAFDGEGLYIEVVTSPNNPDGLVRREGVVNKKWADQGHTFYDLAYYWPQYTPITHAAEYDIMSFTFSKSTGHAGSRIGWAIVKDEEIAKKMTRFIELCSIGVSKDSQTRAAKIMGVICDRYQNFSLKSSENFFEYGHKVMAGRWKKLREAVAQSGAFTLPNYPKEYCLFFGEFADSNPGFAWLKVKDGVEEDCEKFLKEFKIVGRGGKRFGADPSYARVSMLGQDMVFEAFLERLSGIKGVDRNGALLIGS